MNVSSCRPGRFTAPGNGGSEARRTTTSMVLVAPRKEPVERMITILFVSAVRVSAGDRRGPGGLSGERGVARLIVVADDHAVVAGKRGFGRRAAGGHARQGAVVDQRDPRIGPGGAGQRRRERLRGVAGVDQQIEADLDPASARYRARAVSATLREICGSSALTERNAIRIPVSTSNTMTARTIATPCSLLRSPRDFRMTNPPPYWSRFRRRIESVIATCTRPA